MTSQDKDDQNNDDEDANISAAFLENKNGQRVGIAKSSYPVLVGIVRKPR